MQRRVVDLIGVSVLGGLDEGLVLSAVQAGVSADWIFCISHQCHSPEGNVVFVLRKTLHYFFSYSYCYSSFLLPG